MARSNLNNWTAWTSHDMCINWNEQPSTLNDTWVWVGGCKPSLPRYPKGPSRTCYQECGCHLQLDHNYCAHNDWVQFCVCNLEQETICIGFGYKLSMLSIYSPDYVFTVLVSIFINKTHNHFWAPSQGTNTFVLVYIVSVLTTMCLQNLIIGLNLCLVTWIHNYVLNCETSWYSYILWDVMTLAISSIFQGKSEIACIPAYTSNFIPTTSWDNFVEVVPRKVDGIVFMLTWNESEWSRYLCYQNNAQLAVAEGKTVIQYPSLPDDAFFNQNFIWWNWNNMNTPWSRESTLCVVCMLCCFMVNNTGWSASLRCFWREHKAVIFLL